jgi:hypothetical protein
MSEHERIADIHSKVSELHAVVIGDSHGRGGLVSRVEAVESRVAAHDKIMAYGGGAIATVSGWAAFGQKLKAFLNL